MKTTLDIPDGLYRLVKAEAALRGLTVREVTTDLYRRWLREGRQPVPQETPADWLGSWLSAADEATERAPAGPTARDELGASRSRLER